MLRASSRSVGVPCNESQRRTALVSAPGSQVHPERQRLETAWSGRRRAPSSTRRRGGMVLHRGDCRPCSRSGGNPRPSWSLRYPRYRLCAALAQEGDHLVRPRRVAHQVPEMVDGLRGSPRVDVGVQRVPHHSLHWRWRAYIKISLCISEAG